MGIIISARLRAKLDAKTPPVSRAEVEQCFANLLGGILEDKRERHRTTPPTLWFIAETDAGRALKIVYVQDGKDVFLKTAYDPNVDEKHIYVKYGL